MGLGNNLGKTLETTNSTYTRFYSLLFTACAGPDLALGTQWGLATRGHEWR